MAYPLSLLAATQSSGSPTGTGWGDDLPVDLTVLSLAQLMNVPLRAPEPEDEDEPEVVEDDPEDGETIPGVAPDQAGPVVDQDDAPAPQASHGSTEFADPDFGEADAVLPEARAFTLAHEGDDPLRDGDPSVFDGGFEPLQFLVSSETGGSGSAEAFDLTDSSGQNDPEQSDPGQSNPEQSDPDPNDPGQSAPDPSAPDPSEPEQSDPDPSEPEQSDPGQSNPEQSGLGPSDPGPGGSQPSGLTLTGSAADDALTGGSGDDTLAGLNGDDTLTGLAGADWLDGGNGNDTLDGGDGGDTLIGGNGKDSLDGGLGADTLLGGNGKDSLTWDALDITIDGGNGQDTLLAAGADIDLTAFDETLTSIENIDLTDDGGNSVVLGVQDVLDMSSNGTVTIAGDTGDTVDAGTGWTDAGTAGGFHVYTQGLATLNLDVDLTVNLDIA